MSNRSNEFAQATGCGIFIGMAAGMLLTAVGCLIAYSPASNERSRGMWVVALVLGGPIHMIQGAIVGAIVGAFAGKTGAIKISRDTARWNAVALAALGIAALVLIYGLIFLLG